LSSRNTSTYAFTAFFRAFLGLNIVQSHFGWGF
jgi:hypothetical protein